MHPLFRKRLGQSNLLKQGENISNYFGNYPPTPMLQKATLLSIFMRHMPKKHLHPYHPWGGGTLTAQLRPDQPLGAKLSSLHCHTIPYHTIPYHTTPYHTIAIARHHFIFSTLARSLYYIITLIVILYYHSTVLILLCLYIFYGYSYFVVH